MAAAIKPRNGKREYSDRCVEDAMFLLNVEHVTIPTVAKMLNISKHTIRTWKYGPRGERVRGR